MPAERTPHKPQSERRPLTKRQFDETLDKTLVSLGLNPSDYEARSPRSRRESPSETPVTTDEPLMPIFMAPGEAPLPTVLPDVDHDFDPLTVSLTPAPVEGPTVDTLVLDDRILQSDPYRGSAHMFVPPESEPEKPVLPKDVPIEVVAATAQPWDLDAQPDELTPRPSDRLSVIPDVTFHADSEVKQSAERKRSVGEKIRRLGEKALINYTIMRIVGPRNYFEFGRAERKEKRRDAYDRTIIKIGDALLRITRKMEDRIETRKTEKETAKRKAARRKELRQILIDKKAAEIKANSPAELAKKAARARIPEARRASL
jgi:hypothetical protein